jgi:uncharacterized protein YkwD
VTAPANAEDGVSKISYSPQRERLDVAAALQLVNAARAENGLGVLVLDNALSAAAASHAEDLARREIMSHYGEDGSSPYERVEASGYQAVSIGENVSVGQRSAAEAISAWLASAPHRRTLLMPEARDMGIALFEDPTSRFRTYWALVVAEPF